MALQKLQPLHLLGISIPASPPHLEFRRHLAERPNRTLNTAFGSRNTRESTESHGVDVKRAANARRDQVLQWVLSVFESHPPFDDAEMIEQPHAMRIDREDGAVQRIHHDAPRCLQPDAWQGCQVILQGVGLHLPQVPPSKAPEILHQLPEQALDLSCFDAAQASVVNHLRKVIDARSPDRIPGGESLTHPSIRRFVIPTACPR
jgi:hypothetical protein